jgi:hydrogenase expression/formation protein HypC
MCLAIPARIEQLLPDNDLATADVSGVRRNVNIGLLERAELAPGDWVLIHVGFAISKVDEAEARASLEFLEGLGQAWRDEIEALREHADTVEASLSGGRDPHPAAPQERSG